MSIGQLRRRKQNGYTYPSLYNNYKKYRMLFISIFIHNQCNNSLSKQNEFKK